MKQIKIIVIISVVFLFTFNFSFGQNKTKTVTKVNNDVKEISPSKEIKKTDDGKIEVYQVVNNIREVTPIVIIED